MKTLHLPLKAKYFDAIKSGKKTHEFRLFNDYWKARMYYTPFDKIILTKGYPRKNDTARRIERPWRGYTIRTMTHPEFGDKPVRVFAIKVN